MFVYFELYYEPPFFWFKLRHNSQMGSWNYMEYWGTNSGQTQVRQETYGAVLSSIPRNIILIYLKTQYITWNLKSGGGRIDFRVGRI